MDKTASARACRPGAILYVADAFRSTKYRYIIYSTRRHRVSRGDEATSRAQEAKNRECRARCEYTYASSEC